MKLTCYISPEHNLLHLSLAITGMIELAASGEIKFLAAGQHPQRKTTPLEGVLEFDLERQHGMPVAGAIDVFDRSDVFDHEALERAYLYFKRSFHRPDVSALPTHFSNKITPWGPNFACRTVKASLSGANRADYNLALPIEDFEQPPEVALDPVVLFQTRVWSPDSTSDRVQEMNATRMEIVRALREAFGEHFTGGVVPNTYAKQLCPDLLTPHPTHEAGYLAFSKRRLIGVSTRGLHHSVPFKVPEYMAASMAIVSEPLRNRLAEPWTDGVHYLEFRNPQECVACCQRLLSDTPLANALRRANWEYYCSHIRPADRLRAGIRDLLSVSRTDCLPTAGG